MKNLHIIAVSLFLLLFNNSCEISPDQEHFKNLEINYSSKTLRITNFPSFVFSNTIGYSSGITQEFFKLIDKEIYRLLKGESGKVKVLVRFNETKRDKYGNPLNSESWLEYGYINCEELNKYVSFKYWSKYKDTSYMNTVSTASNFEYLFHNRGATID